MQQSWWGNSTLVDVREIIKGKVIVLSFIFLVADGIKAHRRLIQPECWRGLIFLLFCLLFFWNKNIKQIKEKEQVLRTLWLCINGSLIWRDSFSRLNDQGILQTLPVRVTALLQVWHFHITFARQLTFLLTRTVWGRWLDFRRRNFSSLPLMRSF